MRIPFLRGAASRPAIPPDPAEIEVRHDGVLYRIALRRTTQARRMTLRVSSATGLATLTLPARANVATAMSFAQAHGGWLAARFAKLPQRVSFEPGALVPVRGVPTLIVHRPRVPGGGALLTPANGPPELAVGGGVEHVPRRVRDLLQREARRDLTAAVALYSAKVGRPVRRITLRDTRSRWGSCTAAGALNFSWRLIMAPPFVLDYLAAHEVAHLVELNHSHRYWALLSRICPHVDEAEAWLKRHGTGLHSYG